MKRQITCLLAVCMLSALLCGCGRTGKQTAGTRPTAPAQTAATATEAPEPKTLGDIPGINTMIRCYTDADNANFGVKYDESRPLPNGFDGIGNWYPVTNYGSLSELRLHVQQYLSDALIDRLAFGEQFREIDGRLYFRRGSVGYVSYKADMQTEVLRYAEGDDKPLKYPLMFSICDVLLVNKIDVAPSFNFDLDKCIERVKKLNPNIQVFPISALKGEGIEPWADWLRAQTKAWNA